jgi:hypothetical protein
VPVACLKLFNTMSFLKSIFGSKVKVPEFKEIDPDVEVQKAFDSIQEQLPQAQRISRNIAEADTDTTLSVLEKIAPGTRDIIQQQVANLQAGLRGELPADVQRAITDRAAARSVQGGFGGSQFARNLELRDLGLTSLQRIDTAMGQSAQALAQYTSMTPRSSVGSMFLSPQARLTFAQGERNQRFERDMEAARIAAQPDPLVKGIAGTVGKIGGAALGALIGGPAGAVSGGSAGAVGAGIPQSDFSFGYDTTFSGATGYGSSQSQPRYGRRFLANLGKAFME